MSDRRVRGIVALAAVALSCELSAAQGVSGDGRGLASFGDRGLTTFGDRFTEGYGRRPLESFGDIPLSPMGGLDLNRAPAKRGETRSLPFQRKQKQAPRSRGSSGAKSQRLERSRASVASIRGVEFPSFEPSPRFVTLPRVELPSATLDPRLAIADLEATLAEELARARARGDLDVERTLAASLRR